MKKQILCALLALSMLLGMTACSGTSANKEESNSSSQTTAEKDNEESAAATTTPAEPAAEPAQTEPAPETNPAPETEVEQPEELPVITNIDEHYDDNLLFKIDGTTYDYNIADNKMYTINPEIFGNGYIDDIYGKLVVFYDKNDGLFKFYNLETGEFIANMFDTLHSKKYIAEYNPVYKIEESADGVVNYFGVIDKNGEWVVPMSSEYMICGYDPTKYYMDGSDGQITCFMDRDKLERMYYDYKNDEFIDLPQEVDPLNSHAPGNKLCYYTKEFYVYDIGTKETSVFLDTDFFDYSYYQEANNGYAIYDPNTQTYILTDFDFNKYDINLSGYQVVKFLTISENIAAFLTKNDKKTYVNIIDKNGNSLIEPIEGSSTSWAYIKDNYVIVKGMILNYATGEQTTIDKETCYAYDEASGMLIMEKDGGYYLATLDDPDTLINPFEICE